MRQKRGLWLGSLMSQRGRRFQEGDASRDREEADRDAASHFPGDETVTSPAALLPPSNSCRFEPDAKTPPPYYSLSFWSE